jgi:hypothetical protein
LLAGIYGEASRELVDAVESAAAERRCGLGCDAREAVETIAIVNHPQFCPAILEHFHDNFMPCALHGVPDKLAEDELCVERLIGIRVGTFYVLRKFTASIGCCANISAQDLPPLQGSLHKPNLNVFASHRTQ